MTGNSFCFGFSHDNAVFDRRGDLSQTIPDPFRPQTALTGTQAERSPASVKFHTHIVAHSLQNVQTIRKKCINSIISYHSVAKKIPAAF